MPTNMSRVASRIPGVERTLDAELHGRGEVALPGQDQPAHQAAEPGRFERFDLLDLVRPPFAGFALVRAGRRHDQRAQDGPALARVGAVREQRSDDVGEVEPAEQEVRDRWSAQAGRELAGRDAGRPQRRLAPAVRFPLEAAGAALDLGAAAVGVRQVGEGGHPAGEGVRAPRRACRGPSAARARTPAPVSRRR